MSEMDWPPRRDLAGALIAGESFRVTVRPPGGITLISGDLTAGAAALAHGAPWLGLGGRAGSQPALAVIARDRACLLTAAPLGISSRWDARGFAVTPADDAWIFLSLEGPGAGEALAQGCAADLDSGSPSAVALVTHAPAIVLRSDEGGYLLGIESPHVEAVLRWFEAIAAPANRG